MDKNKVNLVIKNQQYSVLSTESPDYMRKLADEVDGRVSAIMDASSRVTLTEALVLTALDLADELKKTAEQTEKLRSEIGDYLEDAEKAKTERDKYKRELSKLRK